MLPTIKEFWSKAFMVDENGKYVYPHYYKATKDLNSSLQNGPGSKGGGYVLICPNCGYAEYTHDKRRKFCSVKCKNEAYRKAYAMSFPESTGIIEKVRLTRVCQFCDEEFKVSRSVVKKGGGVYCSKSCASKARGLVPLTYICKHCGITFKSVWPHNSTFCSINCYKLAPRLDNRNEIVKYVPHLLHKEEMVDERVNHEMYEMMSRERARLPIGERDDFQIEAYTTEMREKAASKVFGIKKDKQKSRKI